MTALDILGRVALGVAWMGFASVVVGLAVGTAIAVYVRRRERA